MSFFFTNVAYASESLNTFLTNANRIIVNPLINLLFALAIVYFLYGVVEFIGNGENEEKKTSGKNHMMWGLVGLTIMLGVWGILGIVMRTFDIKGINPQNNTVELNDYNPTIR